ncbi:ATP-grasp domain-containing protein [Saccharopolyspora taberi]|uniref:ATP-grasp domain-containing protein n=1 Tax=Saccharopolyspora taberi TaxID=60895 RepID=A0ABN3V259_9PSEU
MTIAALEFQIFGLSRLVEAAADAGERLCLLTGDRAIYRHELANLPPDALEVVDVDTQDREAAHRALGSIGDLRGLINSTDTWCLPGADLAHRLGLPGPDPDAVRVLRDKRRVRALLHDHGLSRGRAIEASTVEEIRREVGFPVILKDSAGTSSRNVWLARDEDQLGSALEAARAADLRGSLLAEPFLAGPVYSAETVSWEGKTRLLGVLSRQVSPEPDFRELAASFPVALDESRIEDWAGRVLAAAGHDGGFAHVEFVLTAEGPELVEINPRIGGALVGEALCRSLGTNVYRALVEMALGSRPALLDAPAPAGPAVAFALVYADRTGTLTGWTGLDGLADHPGSPEWYPTSATGSAIAHLHDQRGCTGIVLAEGATAELASHRALAAAGSVRPVIG